MSTGNSFGTADGGWAEIRVQPRELIVPRVRADSDDEIPTLPDLDELQDTLEKEADAITAPLVADKWRRPNSETYAELEADEAHLGDINLAALLTHVRTVTGSSTPEPDTIWTITSLLRELSDEEQAK